MPYIKEPKTRKVKLASDPHYFVIWRENLKYGQIKAISKDAVTTKADGESEIDASKYSDGMLLAHIVDWNLDDEASVKLPITEETLSELEDVDANLLAGLIREQSDVRESERKNA